MIYYFQALLLTFIEALCCTMFFSTFCKSRYEKLERKNISLFLGLFVGFTGIAFIRYDLYLVKALCCIVWIGVIMGWKYETTRIQRFFLAAVYYGMIIFIDRTVLVCLEQSGIVLDNAMNPVRATLYALLCKNILFLVIFMLNRRYQTMGSLSVVNEREWIKLLFFPVLSNLCMAAFATSDNPNEREVLLVSFSFLFLNFMLFYIIEDIVKGEEEKREAQQFRERAKSQLAMYQYMSDTYIRQREQMHDVHNHLLCLQGLLHSGRYEEAERYLNRYQGSWVEEADYINTNHAVINSILNQKYREAKRQGIAMALAVNDLHAVTVKDEDIVVILSNILDNAIEACAGLQAGSRIIRLKCRLEKGKLEISCQNPVGHAVIPENGGYATSKADREQHGIGLKNVKSAVDKYYGEDICCCINGFFTHSVTLPPVIE